MIEFFIKNVADIFWHTNALNFIAAVHVHLYLHDVSQEIQCLQMQAVVESFEACQQ